MPKDANLKIPRLAFTTKAKGRLRELKTDIWIGTAFDPTTKNQNLTKFNGIWDTGATNSVITEAVVKQCNLVPTGMVTVETASGPANQETYFINMGLPNHLSINGVKVTKGLLSGVDVLIGMDVINTGDFAITNANGETWFSFQVPPNEHIDFVEQINAAKKSAPTLSRKIGRNTPCPCGSGKKYKKCHGKGQ